MGKGDLCKIQSVEDIRNMLRYHTYSLRELISEYNYEIENQNRKTVVKLLIYHIRKITGIQKYYLTNNDIRS